ncbi:hypothetical protein AB0E96_04635 [Kitasatospora sp. NPDC036755]|uniref:hypothetical protein n=1 Tax=Kitasatospora sp. NPDC036755 TaxID=3154600 RepID=UPI0033D311FC
MSERAVRPSEVLAEGEVRLLQRALLEWGGPARCSDQLAFGMGFADAGDLLDQCRTLRRALGNDEPVKPVEWARTLLAAEIVFVSDLAGSGVEWRTTTGLSDEATLPILRSIQRKLSRTVSAYYGRRPAAQPRGDGGGWA